MFGKKTPESQFILSIDQGTTGTTASLVDSQGRLVESCNQEFEQIYPQPGWVEHNPEKIWESLEKSIHQLFRKSKVKKSQVVAIGITNQRETVLAWDKKTGKAIYNAIVWQCRRTSDFCEKLKKQKKEKVIRQKTGLVIDPYFSGSKLHWLGKNVEGALQGMKSGQLLVGTMDTYLLWRLTGGAVHKTDVSNASRTMLMNIKTASWDDELLKVFKVPKKCLPEIVPSSGEFGVTKGIGFLPDGISISGMAGDQQAALFGQTCFAKGEAKCTYGTGSFLLMNTGKEMVRSKSGLLSTVAWQLKGDKELTYALEGGAFICGAAVQWLRDEMGLIKKSSDVEELAKQVEDCEGVEFVPSFVGLGAPYWDPDVRGMISGLTRGTGKAHLARATLEAMALQNVDVLMAMQKDSKKKLKRLRVDGGASSNELLMQMQSDFLNVEIDRPEMIETTVIGAAYLAGLGVGFWKSPEEIRKVWKVNKSFRPEMKTAARKKRLLAWTKSIRRAQGKRL